MTFTIMLTLAFVAFMIGYGMMEALISLWGHPDGPLLILVFLTPAVLTFAALLLKHAQLWLVPWETGEFHRKLHKSHRYARVGQWLMIFYAAGLLGSVFLYFMAPVKTEMSLRGALLLFTGSSIIVSATLAAALRRWPV